ncbi:hypothetical protein IS481_04910 [Caldimonas thermodepolymerans]|uniref:Tetratricopeptide repeat protein n=1 Tax=Caldimonas thermodepolymerans TaxID=215580 RepID=A0A2S5T8Z2_9BURK|nr:hypothetical protein [Caldimonas thermodepolymerans]PPE71338.1 hypothetical protein C1702_02655 [Caldimonas thermodepolymerans]QPC32510.1 hypothetical protein IS481_04910 [Caldimonas thermodepolymerans]
MAVVSRYRRRKADIEKPTFRFRRAAPVAAADASGGDCDTPRTGPLGPRVVVGLDALSRWITAGALLLLPLVALGLIVAGVLSGLSTEKLQIDKVDLPERLVQAGMSSERVELAVQAALERLVQQEAIGSPEGSGRAPDVLKLRDPVSLLHRQGTEVVIAGQFISTRRAAFQVQRFLGIGRLQAMVTLRVAEARDGLDLHVHYRPTQGEDRFWRMSVREGFGLLDERGAPLQQLAMEVLLHFHPFRAIELLMARDWHRCRCVSPATVERIQQHFDGLGDFELFQLVQYIEAFRLPDAATLLQFDPSEQGDLARLVLRARLRLPEAPWREAASTRQARFSVQSTGTDCLAMADKLQRLAGTRRDQALYGTRGLVHVAECIASAQDLAALRQLHARGGPRGIDGSAWRDELPYLVTAQLLVRPGQADPAQQRFREAAKALITDETVRAALADLEAWGMETTAMGSVSGASAADTTSLQAGFERLQMRQAELQLGPTCRLATDEPWSFADARCRLAPDAQVDPVVPDDLTTLFVAPESALVKCTVSLVARPGQDLAPVCLAGAHWKLGRVDVAWGWFQQAMAAQAAARQDEFGLLDAPVARETLFGGAAWAGLHLGADGRTVADLLRLAGPGSDEGSASARLWAMGVTCRAAAASSVTPGFVDRPAVPRAELDPLADRVPWIVAERGRRALARGDHAGAREAAASLLVASRKEPASFAHPDPVDPRAFEGHLLMGLALLGQGHRERAHESFGKAVALRPYSVEANVLRSTAFDMPPHPGHRHPCVPAGERYAGSQALQDFHAHEAIVVPVPGRSGVQALQRRPP